MKKHNKEAKKVKQTRQAQETRALLARIEKVLETSVRPFLKVDGGDIRVVSVQNGKLKVKLTGSCQTCPMSETTMKSSVESMIMQSFPEISEVKE